MNDHQNPFFVTGTLVNERITVGEKADRCHTLQGRVSHTEGNETLYLTVKGGVISHFVFCIRAVTVRVHRNIQLFRGSGRKACICGSVPLHRRTGTGTVIAAFYRGQVSTYRIPISSP